MSRPELVWNITDADPELRRTISQSLQVSPLVAHLLVNRGIESAEQAELFFGARLADLHDPFLMKDMDKAVRRILEALSAGEKICVYGDYDVDGVTATALVLDFLRAAGVLVTLYIPGRVSEGYGLNPEAIRRIKAQGVTLIITVDCGISDVEAVRFANSLGMTVIVTDHHMVPEEIAPAYAVINPRQADCRFPFSGLAGVGVAFNLLMALRRSMRQQGCWAAGMEPNLKDCLDLVALGTIADVVPMVDENRIFVKHGLEVLTRGSRPGIQALRDISGVTRGPVTSVTVAYRLAPRLNAAGRLSDAAVSARLLLSDQADEARTLARKIDEDNTRRQKTERRILAEARKMLEPDGVQESIILAAAGWHPGVVGLCASRLSEEFGCPTILFALDEERGLGRGSARSIDGFDIYAAVRRCREWLTAFGGHRGAAGLSLHQDNLDAFRAQFNDIVKQELVERETAPRLRIDAEIPLGALSSGVMEEIELLEPFGPANPEPVFCSRPIPFYSAMTVGNGHLKLKLKEDGRFFDAIGFNMASRYDLDDAAIRLAFVPQFNEFNGSRNVQLNLRDIKRC